MKLDFSTIEQLESSLHQAAADQVLTELARVLAYHKSRQLLEAKRDSLAEAEADLQQAEKEQAALEKTFQKRGEALFEARHFAERNRPPLYDGGTPVKTAHTHDELNAKIDTAQAALRTVDADRRDARQRVAGLQQEIKELQREVELLSELTPPDPAKGLEVILNFVR